jgi:amidohydrolase
MSGHQPTPPYPGYRERMAAQLEADAAATEPLTSTHAGADGGLTDRLTEEVERLADELIELSHDLHTHPELAFAEHHAAQAVAELLTASGHQATVGAYGLETAVSARAGIQRPRVAVLAEYDALPGLGHACGHNVIAATAVGAFLALATVAEELGGSVELVGTPGEEGGGGKEYIARAGGFAEADAAVMLHPAGFDVAEHPWLGVRQLEAVYQGLAAHASATPFLGRNALDGVVTAYDGMARLRQHLLPTDRVHGIITDGGQRPNLVPERAATHFYLRSAEPESLAELCTKATDVFEGAARMTGTEVSLGWDPAPVYLPMRNNHTLAARYAVNMGGRGRRVVPSSVYPSHMVGSTDCGNVSVRVPAIQPRLAIAPPQVAIHDPQFAEWAVGEWADQGVVDGAAGLAATAADFLADAQLRRAVAAEFEADGGRIDVEGMFP